MATALDLQLTEPVIAARPSGPGSWPRAAWRFCRRKPLGAIGGLIVIALSAVVIGSVIALTAGTLSGYFSGWIDTLVQRGVDILLAIPPIVLLIYAISVFASRSGAYVRMFWIIIIVGAIISFGSA